MSFSIKLQYNPAEKNQIGKPVVDVITLTGELKEGTSIVDPVLLVVGTAANIVGSNYLTIEQFQRKYFITDITSVRNGLWEIRAHVDVLESYAADILALKALVQRQESEYSMMLNDGDFHVYQKPHVTTQSFPGGFDTANASYILAVAGGT